MKPRAREPGVPFDGTPGALNAIIDVAVSKLVEEIQSLNGRETIS